MHLTEYYFQCMIILCRPVISRCVQPQPSQNVITSSKGSVSKIIILVLLMEPIVPSFMLNKRDVDTGYKNDTGLYGIVCKQQSAGWCLHSRAVSVCQTLSMWYITVVSKRALSACSCRYVGKYRVLHSPEAGMSYFHHSLHSLSVGLLCRFHKSFLFNFC